MRVSLSVNGEDTTLTGVQPWESLLYSLRERLGLYASKNACEQGECGSCAAIVDGDVVCTCMVMVAQAQGRVVTTLEGLDGDPVTASLQESMVRNGAVQCGFCTPGIVVTATELLSRQPAASDDEIRCGLVGHLCRCTGYAKIISAVAEVRDGLLDGTASAPETGALP